MPGFVDLHCHWLPGVDDGARTLAEAVELLEALHGIGFERVFATPHMRPGLFDNSAASLRVAYDGTQAQLQSMSHLPERDLSSEHFFDELVLQRLASGQGLPYPGGGAVLLEFYENAFPPRVDQLLAELRRGGLVPVVAHPERYRILWQRPEILERLLDVGAVALLDVAALVGKYGRGPQRCAELLLERGAYRAACSDAHRPEDVSDVARAIRWIADHYGEDELHALLSEGPRSILRGPPPA
jgi:protein-tyrosine phosphatase